MESTKATIEEDVLPEELEMLRKFGLENGDGQIDKAEFIILCMVRTGTDPELIKFICQIKVCAWARRCWLCRTTLTVALPNSSSTRRARTSRSAAAQR